MQSLTFSHHYQTSSRSLLSIPGLLLVLAIHAGLFYFLWNQKLIPPPDKMVTLFAQLITAPPAPEPAPEPVNVKPQPIKAEPVKKPPTPVKIKEKQIVTKAATTAAQKVAQTPPERASDSHNEKNDPAPVVAAARPTQMPAGPVALSSELSVSCPKLAAPVYPAISRRMGEEGKLVLRVELDEKGYVDNAKVVNSSGYERLDNAALTAVKGWQCNPAQRDGQPARAIALQPFNFVLQGN